MRARASVRAPPGLAEAEQLDRPPADLGPEAHGVGVVKALVGGAEAEGAVLPGDERVAPHRLLGGDQQQPGVEAAGGVRRPVAHPLGEGLGGPLALGARRGRAAPRDRPRTAWCHLGCGGLRCVWADDTVDPRCSWSGLTGGIGSGKSTVSSLLTERGALVVDTDVVARQVVAPGGPAHDALVRRFGPDVGGRPAGAGGRGVLRSVGPGRPQRDRPPRGAGGGGPADGRAPGGGRRRGRAGGAVAGGDGRRLRGGTRWSSSTVPEEIAVRRLVEQRGMDEADVRRRMAAQASRDERMAIADVVIHNDASMDDLESQADETWEWIQELLEPSSHPSELVTFSRARRPVTVTSCRRSGGRGRLRGGGGVPRSTHPGVRRGRPT